MQIVNHQPPDGHVNYLGTENLDNQKWAQIIICLYSMFCKQQISILSKNVIISINSITLN